MRISVSFACMSVYHMYSTCRSQKQALELWVVVSRHVGAGNQTGVSCKSSQCSSTLSYLSSPQRFNIECTEC